MAEIISIPLWLTEEHPCSYLERFKARSLVVDPKYTLDAAVYSQLIAQGFRRSGDRVYKPHCRDCRSCIATRIEVDKFQADRKQKRCIKANADTRISIKPAEFDNRHFELYRRYQSVRHTKDHPDESTPDEYLEFLGSDWCKTWFVEFTIADKLAAIAVVDVLDRALSAVYTFFDPEFSRFSPGVFAILWQIDQARQMDLEYLYLGYWIKNCRKMNYKNQYRPLFGLDGRDWRLITDPLNNR